MADGAELVRRCHAALVASMVAAAAEAAAAPSPAAPLPTAPSPAAPTSEAEQLRCAMQGQLGSWQPGTWHGVALWGELARGGAAPHALTLSRSGA